MTTSNKISECLDKTLNEYKKPVTQLSKTAAKNDYIISEICMFDWDTISKKYSNVEYSSVDAVYYSLKNNTLYLFEFKKYSFV